MKGLFGQVRLESPTEQANDVDRPARTPWGSRTSLRFLAGCGLIVMMRFTAPLLLPIVLDVMLFYVLMVLKAVCDHVEGLNGVGEFVGR